uniref:Nck-associated protein 5-like protein n=1 Tax=Lygus hesperus TaxID=30085 RepID=A0A0A9Y4X5_LYGHE
MVYEATKDAAITDTNVDEIIELLTSSDDEQGVQQQDEYHTYTQTDEDADGCADSPKYSGPTYGDDGSEEDGDGDVGSADHAPVKRQRVMGGSTTYQSPIPEDLGMDTSLLLLLRREFDHRLDELQSTKSVQRYMDTNRKLRGIVKELLNQRSNLQSNFSEEVLQLGKRLQDLQERNEILEDRNMKLVSQVVQLQTSVGCTQGKVQPPTHTPHGTPSNTPSEVKSIAHAEQLSAPTSLHCDVEHSVMDST